MRSRTLYNQNCDVPDGGPQVRTVLMFIQMLREEPFCISSSDSYGLCPHKRQPLYFKQLLPFLPKSA